MYTRTANITKKKFAGFFSPSKYIMVAEERERERERLVKKSDKKETRVANILLS